MSPGLFGSTGCAETDPTLSDFRRNPVSSANRRFRAKPTLRWSAVFLSTFGRSEEHSFARP